MAEQEGFEKMMQSFATAVTQPRPNVAHRARHRTIREFYHAAIDALTSSLDVLAVENRNGILRIEATARDDFQKDLANVAATAEERQDIRDAAILLAQLGVRSSEVESMARLYHIARGRGVSLQDVRDISSIKARALREASER